MNIRKREESLEQLSQMLKQEQMKKLITQGYSDVSLSVIADFKRDCNDGSAAASGTRGRGWPDI